MTTWEPFDGATLEEIRSLQHRYCIWVDRKEWNRLQGLFAPDARLELNDRAAPIETATGIADYIRNAIGTAVTSHHATGAEITRTGADEAHALWSMFYATKGQPTIAFGFYEMAASRASGQWVIERLRRDKAFDHPTL